MAKKKVNPIAKHAQKHPFGFAVTVFLLVAVVYVAFSKPESPSQVRAREGVKTTSEKFIATAGNLRQSLRKQWGSARSEDRQIAMNFWTRLTAFERVAVTKEIDVEARKTDWPAVSKDLGTSDLSKMFGNACPDIFEGAAYAENPNYLWRLMDAWFSGNSLNDQLQDPEQMQSFNQLVENGFWSDLESLGFSKSEAFELSYTGWSNIREVILGVFFKNLGPGLLDRFARMDAGEKDVLPVPPVPWRAEAGAEHVAFPTTDSFAGSVASKKHAVVMFYAPWCGHCKAFKPGFGEAATALKDADVVLVAVDCTTDRPLCSQYNVSGFPTTKYFVDGVDTADFDADRSTYGVVKFLNAEGRLGGLDELEKSLAPPPVVPYNEEPGAKDVVHMTDGTFATEIKANPAALVMFYAPWCGHCKSFKPELNQVATQLKEQTVTIGAVDCTVEKDLGEQFEVKGYPTILYFKDGEMSEKYSGGRKANEVVAWLQGKGAAQKQEL